MAQTSHVRSQKAEMYAHTLLEAAKAEGRELKDLNTLDALSNMLSEVTDTLHVLIDEGDEDLLPQIAHYYAELFREEPDVVAVDVTTAIPLDDELRAKVQKSLEEEYKKPVYMVEHVDKSIMGGIIFYARGVRRDASVRTRLETIRRSLKEKGVE